MKACECDMSIEMSRDGADVWSVPSGPNPFPPSAQRGAFAVVEKSLEAGHGLCAVRKKLLGHNGSEARNTKEYMEWTLGYHMRTLFTGKLG